MHRDRWKNIAYLLVKIRDGIGTWEELCRHFGWRNSPYSSYTEEGIVFQSLRALERAQLIRCDPPLDRWQKFPSHLTAPEELKLTTTPFLDFLQRTLQLSLADLAASDPDHRLVITPHFSAYDFKLYQRDLFVLMPFTAELLPIYDDHLKLAAAELGKTIARADDFLTNKEVMNEIWNGIVASKIIIAECSGRNSNVFYEIGLAHAIGKPVILIAQRNDDMPFDLQHRRHIIYEPTKLGLLALRNSLKETIAGIDAEEA